MSDMELITRVEQLEGVLKVLRPDLHFPSTATLEQRLRWLEIVMEEIRAKNNHGVYAETLTEEKLRKLLHHTVYIKQDRITLMSLTADPASCAAGDQWFRSDLGKAKLAVDAVVANAKLLRREGDTIPAAEIASLDVSKITSGRFSMARMLDGTSGQVLTAQGAGVNPVYAAVSVAKPNLITLIDGTWAAQTGSPGGPYQDTNMVDVSGQGIAHVIFTGNGPGGSRYSHIYVDDTMICEVDSNVAYDRWVIFNTHLVVAVIIYYALNCSGGSVHGNYG